MARICGTIGRMKRGRRVAAWAGVAAVVMVAAGLLVCREEIAAWRRSLVVRQLLDPKERNAIWREVVGWQRYADGNPRYRIELDPREEVQEVVLCPQPSGNPLLAVFSVDRDISGWDAEFTLLRMDGTLLPDPHGRNITERPFRDLNGDSVLDRADSLEVGFQYDAKDEPRFSANILQVIPITERQDPILMVAYQRKGQGLKWRLRESDRPGIFDVVFEKPGEGEAADTLRAIYRWSESDKAYEGPPGSVDGDFLRLDLGRSLEHLEEFAQSGTR